jgi:hypothetical protein
MITPEEATQRVEISLERGPLDQPPPTCLEDPRKFYPGVAKMHFASGGSIVILGLHETKQDLDEPERLRTKFKVFRCASGAVILRAKLKVFVSGRRLLKFEARHNVYFFFYSLNFLDHECLRSLLAKRWFDMTAHEQVEMCGELSRQRFIDRHSGGEYTLLERNTACL